MAQPRDRDILFSAGGAELARTGAAWRRRRSTLTEPEAPTFSRADAATCATYLDRDLTYRTAAAAKLRTDWTGSVPSLLLETTRKNLCLQSENFGTTWAAVGTPTRTPANLSFGAILLDLIGDDDGAGLEGYTQTITYTGNGTKAVSCVMYPGTSTSSVIRLRDTTAGADCLLAVVTFSGATPIVTMSTGTYLGYVVTIAGLVRLLFQTAAVTAANTNSLQVYPATNASLVTTATGNVNIGCVMTSDAPFPGSYIKNAASAVTRASDALSFPIGFGGEDVLTVYAKMPRPPHADAVGTLDSDHFLLSAGSAPGFTIYFGVGARVLACDVTSGTTQTASGTIPAGAMLELCAQFANLTTAAKVRLDVNDGTGFGAYSTAVGAMSGLLTLILGDNGTGKCLDGGINKLLIARNGPFTLADMQAVPW